MAKIIQGDCLEKLNEVVFRREGEWANTHEVWDIDKWISRYGKDAR